jgi:hypothetical protein
MVAIEVGAGSETAWIESPVPSYVRGCGGVVGHTVVGGAVVGGPVVGGAVVAAGVVATAVVGGDVVVGATVVAAAVVGVVVVGIVVVARVLATVDAVVVGEVVVAAMVVAVLALSELLVVAPTIPAMIRSSRSAAPVIVYHRRHHGLGWEGPPVSSAYVSPGSEAEVAGCSGGGRSGWLDGGRPD